MDLQKTFRNSFLVLIAWVIGDPCAAQNIQPKWTTENTLKQDGQNLSIVCEGMGPSLDLARKFALESCHSTAKDQINGDFTVKSLSLESEKSVNYHAEVSSAKTVKGLICKPENEHTEKLDGRSKIWLKCKYDLTKTEVVSTETQKTLKVPALIDHNEKVNQVPSYKIDSDSKKLNQAEARNLMLTSVPKCDEILVRGSRPRAVPCDEMPKSFVVHPGDTELIVRSSGFKPKHINIKAQDQNGSVNSDSLEVYLEK